MTTTEPTLESPLTGDMTADQTTLDVGDEGPQTVTKTAEPKRRGPGRPKGSRNRKPSGSTSKATSSTTRRAPANLNYGKLAGEVIDNLVIAPLIVGAVTTQSDALYADTYAVTLHRDALADGLADAAKRSTFVAGALSRVAVVAPAVGLVTALSQLGLQLAVNHGRMAAGFMRTVPADVMAAAARADLARQAAEAAEAHGVAYPPPPPPPAEGPAPAPWDAMPGEAVA